MARFLISFIPSVVFSGFLDVPVDEVEEFIVEILPPVGHHAVSVIAVLATVQIRQQALKVPPGEGNNKIFVRLIFYDSRWVFRAMGSDV